MIQDIHIRGKVNKSETLQIYRTRLQQNLWSSEHLLL
jgi:hypothetical protein